MASTGAEAKRSMSGPPVWRMREDVISSGNNDHSDLLSFRCKRPPPSVIFTLTPVPEDPGIEARPTGTVGRAVRGVAFYMTLGEFLNLSLPLFPRLQNGMIVIMPALDVAVGSG